MSNSHEPIDVALISREPAFFSRIEALAASSEREGGLPCRIRKVDSSGNGGASSTDIVLIDLDSSPDEFLRQIPTVRRQNGRAWIVVACHQPSVERLLKAVRAGANDYLPHPPTMSEFHELLLRVREAAGDGAGKPPAELISVFGNTGGVGTTSLSIQVAASLAGRPHAGSVVLADLVLQRGDVSAFLDVPTQYSAVNLVNELDRVDPSYLQSVLPKHSSGVYILPAPYAPDDADLVTPVQVGRMIHSLRSVFDAVVVDAGHEFSETVLSVLDASSRILLLALPLLPSIRNARRTLELFDRLNYDPGKVVLVLNRHDAQGKLDSATIEEALGRPVQWSIPNDYETTVKAINQGATVRAVQPGGKLASNIDQLVARHVLGQEPSPAPQLAKEWAGRWSSLLQKFRR